MFSIRNGLYNFNSPSPTRKRHNLCALCSVHAIAMNLVLNLKLAHYTL